MKKSTWGWIGLWLIASVSVHAQNQAGILIQNSTGELISRCVEFQEESLTVQELLNRSGFKTVFSENGDSLCFLHDDGISDPVECANNPDESSWNFYTREQNTWEIQQDLTSFQVTHGSLIGFDYGIGSETELPLATFSELCGITNHAGLVIDHSDGSRKTVVVEFPGETITGLQLLQKSGLDLVTVEFSFGTAICAIDGEGPPPEDCFNDPLGRFWNFNILDDENQWYSSPVGSGDSIVRDEDVHGYIFGEWGVVQPPITRSEIFGFQSAAILWECYD